jgi:putative membrane protein
MKFSHLRTAFFGMAVMSPALFFGQFDPMTVPSSQSQPNRAQQTASPATQDSGPNSGDVGQVMADKMFLRKAAEGGIAEVKLGQLAAKKGSTDDVRAFAQKMVDDHTKLNNDVASVADAMGVMLPKEMNKEDQAEYDKLNALSGNDFDIEYLTFMVKDHHKDLHAFRIEAASPTDPALHDAVVRAEGVVHEHTVMVDKLARARGVPVPAHGPHPTPAPAPSPSL